MKWRVANSRSAVAPEDRIRQIEARAFEMVRKAAKARATQAPAAMLAASVI